MLSPNTTTNLNRTSYISITFGQGLSFDSSGLHMGNYGIDENGQATLQNASVSNTLTANIGNITTLTVGSPTSLIVGGETLQDYVLRIINSLSLQTQTTNVMRGDGSGGTDITYVIGKNTVS